MTTLLNRIHTRVGDFWWYSAMIFIMHKQSLI